ncbi:hypothetical protein Tco_0913412, partial [Tanacetum coccineum]
TGVEVSTWQPHVGDGNGANGDQVDQSFRKRYTGLRYKVGSDTGSSSAPSLDYVSTRVRVGLQEDIYEEEEYPFVNKYPSFQEEHIVLVEEESYPVYDTDNEEEESMPVYDTDIEDVIEEEEGFVGKGGFGGEGDNIENIVVVANDICSSMIQTTLSVDVEEDVC